MSDQAKPIDATSDQAQHSITLLGEKDSGKSTWLAAFLQSLEDRKAAHFERRHASQDQRALIKLTDPLLDAKFPERTQRNEPLSLTLALRLTGVPFMPQDVDLLAGDYAGEELEALFKDRTGTWTAQWRARAQADALILMLKAPSAQGLPLPHQWESKPDRQRWEYLLREQKRISGSEQAGLRLEGGPAEDSADDPFDDPSRLFGAPELLSPAGPPEASPEEQVRVPGALALVELLQFMRHARGLCPGERPLAGSLRVVIAISAWDAVDARWRAEGPERWLAQQMPLLEDYLWCNFPSDDLLICGLSAVGGDLNDEAFQSQYLSNPHRGFVEWWGLNQGAAGIQRCTDIALPLYFALAGRQALSLGNPIDATTLTAQAPAQTPSTPSRS